MITLHELQLWILSQSIITAVCWRVLGFPGLVGSLIGSLIYFLLK
jgi:hypothetical protein